MTYRILVTGSRDWTDKWRLEKCLGYVYLDLLDDDNLELDDPEAACTLVHGACPTGADAMADRYARLMGWAVETHPADWSQGRKAGPARNLKMVELGADACVAFIGRCTSPRCHLTEIHPSHGASGCAQLAEDHGILTRRIGYIK